MKILEANTMYPINLDWKFVRGDEPKAWLKDYDDSAWQTVTIPHDWSVTEPFSIDHASGTGYLPAGTGWYRKAFELAEETKGKRVYITFDGVYNNAQVWVNSYYLGKRPNGYVGFTYDITDFVCYEEEKNIVTVKVDHKYVADSRWFTGSGIYRKVSLQIKEQICVDNHGVFITTPVVTPKESILNSNVTFTNHTTESADLIVRTSLVDQDTVVAVTESKVSIQANDTQVIDNQLKVNHANLWSPETPYLYHVVNELIKDGVSISKEITTTGFRTFRFDANNGFYLNGEHMKIKGVCLHHDAGCLGAAVRPKVWERRLQKLKEMGCNAIRMSHNPHMPELYDLCDSMGFLVDDEAFDEWEGVKNKWHIGHNVYPPLHYGYAEEFPEWHERDLAEMVLRDRNHPSVIMWSIGNEIDYPNDPYCHPHFNTMTGNNDHNKPAQERVYNPNKPNADRLTTIAKKLNRIVKTYDITRPTTLASAFPELSNLTGLTEAVDIIGYNYKEHLYEQDHKLYPERVIIGSENGHGAEAWLAVKNNSYIPSQFLWTGIDYLGETGGWPWHGSSAGLLNTAGYEKSSYYLRKSWWNDSPMVQVVTAYKEYHMSHHYHYQPVWNYVDGEKINVNCYTNCEKVELLVNNECIETKWLRDYGDLLYIPFEVSYSAGEIKAVAYRADKVVAEHTIKTTSAPVQIEAIVLDNKLEADGEDMTHIEACIVDYAGHIVRTSENMLTVEVSGPGQVLGIDNGDLADTTPFSAKYRRAYDGKLLIYVSSTTEKGEIEVKISSPKLKAKIVRITCI